MALAEPVHFCRNTAVPWLTNLANTLKMIIRTFNKWHLGDNLIHLNYITRALHKNKNLEWVHYCRPEYLGDLGDLASQLERVSFMPLLECPEDAVDAWIGSNDFIWLSQKRLEWASFHIEWFSYLSKSLNISNPIFEFSDLFFDLNSSKAIHRIDQVDVLVNNTIPLSGQVPEFNINFLNWVADELLKRGLSVVTTNPGSDAVNTQDFCYSVTEIAWLSTKAKFIIGIPNGPIWPTFNILNEHTVSARIFLICGQVINLRNTFCYQREADFVRQVNKLILTPSEWHSNH